MLVSLHQVKRVHQISLSTEPSLHKEKWYPALLGYRKPGLGSSSVGGFYPLSRARDVELNEIDNSENQETKIGQLVNHFCSLAKTGRIKSCQIPGQVGLQSERKNAEGGALANKSEIFETLSWIGMVGIYYQSEKIYNGQLGSDRGRKKRLIHRGMFTAILQHCLESKVAHTWGRTSRFQE